jgi:glycosyltransferase involved in cell wall biosynthesis
MHTMNYKVAIIVSHPIQYQDPLWRGLAQYPDLDVHVFFGSDFSVRGYRDKDFGVSFAWDIPLTQGYTHTFLSPNPSINSSTQLQLDMRQMTAHLQAFQADCVLTMGHSPLAFYGQTMLVARLLRLPVVLRPEATDDAITRSAKKKLIRHVFLRLFYSQVRVFLAQGQHAYSHYRAKGVAPDKIVWAPYAIDSQWFERQIQIWRPQRDAVRQELGFTPDQTVFLFAGKLIDKKNPLLMVAALRHLFEHITSSVALLFVGDGELRPQLEAALYRLPAVTTYWAGFQNQRQLARFYCAADCLLLPSAYGETWGLVVNEALQCGIPAIVSEKVGCYPDLIVEGQTGFVFPTGDAVALADCMQKMITLLDKDRSRIFAACREKARAYSIEYSIAGIYKALCQARGAR